MSNITTATLLINRWDSKCGHCGKPTLAGATHHTDVSGYSPERGGGCGALFVDKASMEYPPDHPDFLTTRPDLPAH